MAEIYQLLKELTKQLQKQDINADFILGSEWLNHLKGKLSNCIIASSLSRKVLANALMNDSKLILTIFPPSFIIDQNIILHKEKLEMLRLLLEKRIAVFSLSEKWLTTIHGGFEFFLRLINFSYTKNYLLFSTINNNTHSIDGTIGEIKQKIPFKNLVELVSQNVDFPIFYNGCHDHLVNKIALFLELNDEDVIYQLTVKSDFDALLVGDISYSARQAIAIAKIPVIILGRTNLENVVLGKIRRLLMEQMTLELPKIITIKEELFGTVHFINQSE